MYYLERVSLNLRFLFIVTKKYNKHVSTIIIIVDIKNVLSFAINTDKTQNASIYYSR